jgi:hypothetical protein
MRFRLTSSFLIFISIISVIACGRRTQLGQRPDRENVINLNQNVTTDTKPQDAIFLDFQNNWRKFISPSTEFTLPVVPINEKQKTAWDPIVLSECVYSTDAGSYVPQVTLIWNGPASQTPPSPINREEQGATESSKIRFDLTVQYKGFEKNYYTTALPTEKLKRFNLPSNSELVSHPEAVLLTGPGLFPKLMDFRTEVVKERDTNRDVEKQTLVLRDLSPGLTYTIRLCVRGDKQWTEDREFVFLTPVCPKGF